MKSVELSPGANAFYNEGTLQFSSVQGRRGVVLDMSVEMPTHGLVEAFEAEGSVGQAIGDNVTRLYDSVEVREATVDGHVYPIEIGILEGTGQRVRLHNATYSSSLVANHGNGFEVARDAYLDPDVTQVYVGAPGIGMTSPLTLAEQRYLMRYGSLLDVDKSGSVRALPFVHALGKVLHDMGVVVTDLHSDSAGALPNIAYGAVYGGGNILTAHQNVRPGIKDIGALGLAYGMLRLDSQRSKAHAVVSPDVLKANSAMLDLANGHIDSGYTTRGLKDRRSLPMLVSNLVGLGRGPLQGDPLVEDNIAFARANRDARVLLTVGDQDPLAEHANLGRRMRGIVHLVSLESDAPVHAVIFERVSHNVHTHYPQYLRAVSAYCLGG